MSKTLRITLGLVVLVALVAIGLSGTAWADKLNVGTQAPVKSGLQAPVRQAGTVVGGAAVPGGGTATVGEFIVTLPAGVTGAALTELPSGISAPAGKTVVPGTLVQFTGTGNTPADITFTYAGLASGQTVSYWNGTAWVDLTAGADGKYTIPSGTPLPIYVAAFSS